MALLGTRGGFEYVPLVCYLVVPALQLAWRHSDGQVYHKQSGCVKNACLLRQLHRERHHRIATSSH
jgi:hypothetical protein